MSLQDESAIVWLEDIDQIDYVRSVAYRLRSRQRPPPRHWFGSDSRLVGYSTLAPDAKSVEPGYFERRCFYLAPHDRNGNRGGCYTPCGAPVEAVDPRTVAPGVRGEITARVWGDRS